MFVNIIFIRDILNNYYLLFLIFFYIKFINNIIILQRIKKDIK